MAGRKLTHIDQGGAARMVDVSEKAATERVAVAEGRVRMSKATLDLVLSGNAKKGDVLGAARIAGIMAAKKTHDLIPLCHPLAITKVEIDIAPDDAAPGGAPVSAGNPPAPLTSLSSGPADPAVRSSASQVPPDQGAQTPAPKRLIDPLLGPNPELMPPLPP